MNSCHIMEKGEVLNAGKSEYPLFHAVLYGDKVLTEKFSKRLSCAIRHLPLSIRFTYEYDTLKALEQGISIDPTLLLDNQVFFEGLVSAELMTEAFEKMLTQKRSERTENITIENKKRMKNEKF